MQPILHHYPTSPWAEVSRLGLGLKGLSWGSVEVPSICPKPGLTALTGGYVRTPVLQIGADIHCDTAAIADALEALQPRPSLYPAPLGEGQRLLAAQAGGGSFMAAVGTAMGDLPHEGMEDFWADRERRFGMKVEAFRAMAPHLKTQFQAHLALLDAALADGRAFLGGDSPGQADFAHYQLIWFQGARRGGDLSAVIHGFPALGEWTTRVAAIGHGAPHAMQPDEAIAIARAATPRAADGVEAGSGFAVGQPVAVTQEGSKDPPVTGKLAALSARRIVIRIETEQAGALAVHLPRAGQVVLPA